ncbi:MAG: MCE family protein [Planctomycetes bacterium]|nr:MCE family protein [Planctomycetota bacterium]
MTQPASVPDVVVRARRTLPVVWVIPLVALAVASYMWYRAVQERGPEITISFETAAGLEPGKTKLRLKDLAVGVVSTIELADDLSGVTVTARMERGSERFLLDSTRFWVVRPRLGLGGISGLDTVISGAYIEVDPGRSGAHAHRFAGLEAPPLSPVDAPGLRLLLLADGKGSVDVGSYVYHRQIEVGRVERFRWVEGQQGVAFDVYIEAPYANLVRANTRFWNASGVHVSLGADGIEVQTQGLDALLGGGIAFGQPEGEDPGPEAPSGSTFALYADQATAQEVHGERHDYIVFFRESVRGLAQGAPVEFQGIKVGTVKHVTVEFDPATMEARIPVRIEIEPARIGVLGDEKRTADERQALLEGMIARGLRARLQSGNLLTGSLFVEFVFDPTTEVQLTGGAPDGVPEIPTIRSQKETLGDTLARLPDLVSDLSRSAQGLADILASPELPATLAAFSSTAEDLSRLLDSLQDDVPAAVADVRGTLDEANALLAEARGTLDTLRTGLDGLLGQGGDAATQLQRTLADVSKAVGAIGRLADYLERHPEALLSGKD